MGFSSLHQVVHTLDHQRYLQRQRSFQMLLACWPEVVGETVAAHTRPLEVQRRVLKVATSSPVWSQNLLFQRPQILKKLRERLPDQELTDIRFSPAQWCDRPSSQSFGEATCELLWQQHPSQIGRRRSRHASSPSSENRDPNRVFQQWSSQMQARSRHLPQCPRCQCPTPPGELQRWSVCALCAAQNWKH